MLAATVASSVAFVVGYATSEASCLANCAAPFSLSGGIIASRVDEETSFTFNPDAPSWFPGPVILNEARRITLVDLIPSTVQPSVTADLRVNTDGLGDTCGDLSSSDHLSFGSQLANSVRNNIKHGIRTLAVNDNHDHTFAADQHETEHKHEQAIRFNTANVSTLSPQDVDSNLCKGHLCMSTRISLLESSFNEAGCDVIGLQESCIQKHGVYNGKHYAMYMSSATPQGKFGSQLWIRHALGVRICEVRYISARLLAAVFITKTSYLC